MERSRSFGNCRLVYLLFGAFLINYSAVCGQNVTCGPVSSATANVFSTYNVSISGSDDYTLTYDPVEYGPGNRMPLGTSQVTATATMTSSPMNVIGSCVFNVTVDISELPIRCPPTNDVEPADPGEPTFHYVASFLELLPGYDYESVGQIRNDVRSNTSDDVDVVVNNRFPVGVHAVSVRYYDDELMKECNFTLTVVDTQPPIINCPQDVVSSTSNVIHYVARGITDNIPDPSILSSIAYTPASLRPGARFPPARSDVTISLSDAAGNVGSCSFSVYVESKSMSGDQ